MTHQVTVSDLGLRLIKAYEGYRAESRELVSGERVIGFGHRLANQDILLLTPEEAEVLLRNDIAPVEDVVNEAIFAPLTQGQFDALCSLAYNIGPEAFLSSDVVKAINNGRPIEAADGFDVWRKAEIDGQSFVIDALVRRRTAEKALFLKPGNTPVTSPRDSVPPVKDEGVLRNIANLDGVFTATEADGYVGSVPYDATPNQGRRREDGPAGVLELSEYYEDEDETPFGNLEFDPEDDNYIEGDDEASGEISPRAATPNDDQPAIILSPIAEAAAEVSTRLDALIEDYDGLPSDAADLPDTLLDVTEGTEADTDKGPSSVILPFTQDDAAENTESDLGASLLEDDLVDNAIDDTQKPSIDDLLDALDNELNNDTDLTGDSASRFIESPDGVGEADSDSSSVIAYGIMLLSGVVMLALSFYTWMNDPVALIGTIGPIAALVGIIMGGVIIFASIWYIFKSSFNTNT